jgi:hypothetical protein
MLDFGADGDQIMVSVEVDLSSERGPAWKRKVEHLAAWASGPYRQQFGSDSLTIAVIAPGDGRRSDQLWHWTEAALTQLGRQDLAPLFVFTGLDAAQISPASFWLDAVCRQPFRTDFVPLVEGWSR